MIITTMKIHSRSKKRREILLTLKGLVGQMVRDGSCLKTELCQDIHDRNIFYIIRECQTKEDLERYQTSKSQAVILGIETLLAGSLEVSHAMKISSCSRGQ